MPSRRSKSKERERKQKYRANRSQEQVKTDNEKAKKGMAENRKDKTGEKRAAKEAKQILDKQTLYCETVSYKRHTFKAKLRMKKKREMQTEVESKLENRDARDRMRNQRIGQSEEKGPTMRKRE